MADEEADLSWQVKESALECLGHLVACTGDWGFYGGWVPV